MSRQIGPGASGREVSLADKVAFLQHPASYPEPTAAVRVVETHMSWVFVTDRFVYKLKKPVRLPYLDYSTLARRHAACVESVRLNRRLAPSVYLGVVPLTVDGDGIMALGDAGRPGVHVTEWLEHMVRVPEDRMLDVAIAAGTVTADDVRRFSGLLAGFYGRLPAEPMSTDVYLGRLRRTLEETAGALRPAEYGLDQARLGSVTAALDGCLVRHRGIFEARVAAGRIVEAHGDLRPEHVCLTDPPMVIDCLEFDRALRVQDVADELSYLAMECEFAGAPFIGPIVLETYERLTGDRIPPSLSAFHGSLRALIRAKLAVWHLPDYPAETHGHWLSQASGYLALAVHHVPD